MGQLIYKIPYKNPVYSGATWILDPLHIVVLLMGQIP